jgi:hypothetical protein
VTTKDALGIIWQTPGIRGQSEADGLIFYGYWGRRTIPDLDAEEFRRLWPKDSVECIRQEWKENYLVSSIEMHIVSHPPATEWFGLLETSMKWFTSLGAIVVWCGGEESSQSIESLGPDGGDGLVYAGYSAQTGLLCRSGLDDERQFLGDAEADLLWKVVEMTDKADAIGNAGPNR